MMFVFGALLVHALVGMSHPRGTSKKELEDQAMQSVSKKDEENEGLVKMPSVSVTGTFRVGVREHL